jgi:hypothetical protein
MSRRSCIGSDGRDLTRGGLVLRVGGGLPSLHLLHLIHGGGAMQADGRAECAGHRRRIAGSVPSAHQSTFIVEACSETNEKLFMRPVLRVLTFTFSSVSPRYLSLLASNLYIPVFPQ